MKSLPSPGVEIVGLGVCCEDRIGLAPRMPKADEGVHLRNYLRQCGGMVSTALAAAQKLGTQTAFVGMAGHDDAGKWLKRELTRQKVDTSGFILRKGFPTPFSMIVVHQPTGHRRIFHYRPVDFDLTADEIHLDLIRQARYLHLDGHYLDVACTAAQEARKHHVQVCLDASFPYKNLDRLLPFVDYLICNRHFPMRYTGCKDLRAALRQLAKTGCRLVAATLGKEGVLILQNGRFKSIPAFKVRVVDSTGAGDVFHGAFLSALCKNLSLHQAAVYASAAAALSCQGLGGQGALPTHEGVIEFLKALDK